MLRFGYIALIDTDFRTEAEARDWLADHDYAHYGTLDPDSAFVIGLTTSPALVASAEVWSNPTAIDPSDLDVILLVYKDDSSRVWYHATARGHVVSDSTSLKPRRCRRCHAWTGGQDCPTCFTPVAGRHVSKVATHCAHCGQPLAYEGAAGMKCPTHGWDYK